MPLLLRSFTGLLTRLQRAATPGLFCLLLCSLLGGLSACHQAPSILPQQAYIWQRQWTPAVALAMQSSSKLVDGWRVLAAERDAQNQWQTTAPDWQALKSSAQALTLVVRIDGRADLLDADAQHHINDILARWRRQGVNIAGIEIDYDCATSKLPAYATFLTALRRQLPGAVRLSITALPTWLDSAALPALLAVPDESVLQVHAVMNPRQGLFDPQHAHAWLSAYAGQTRLPWRVALPSYSTRVSWDAAGRISAVESERPLLVSGQVSQELVAAPATVSGFIAQLEKNPPPGLAGIVWFRLPTDDDARAWSLPTWQAVLARRPLQPMLALSADAHEKSDPELRDIMLSNTGNADAALPPVVRIDAACGVADGINGYALENDAQGKYLRRTQAGLLRAGYRRNIGWLRCRQQDIQLTVER